MGCKILVGNLDEGTGIEGACFYDSVTDTAFGELLNDLEEAESFQEWVKEDLRELSQKEFSNKLKEFREHREQE